MKKLEYLIAALVLLMAGHAACHAGNIVRGRVTCEGKPVAGTVVSDGSTCTSTDAKGRYEIETAPGSRFVFVSTPAGYMPEVTSGSIPVFYRELPEDMDDGTAYTCDFSLLKNPADDTRHVFFVQADVQLIEKSNLDGYSDLIGDMNAVKKDILASAGEGQAPDIFGLDCGDIVGDTPSLFPPYIETAAAMDMPIYRAIGNHDMDYYGRTFETSYRTFENYFGPTCYSFNKGSIHYIVINNNFYIGREYFYIGYVDERTFGWLEQDLSYVPEGSTIVLMMHMPSRLTQEQQPFAYSYGNLADQTVNAASLHALLAGYNTHIISGHMHYNLNICFSDRLMEHNTAAVCGTWWCTDVCLDGTPVGYGIYKADGDELTWTYKSSGKPVSHQAKVYMPGSSDEYPEALIANVWNWDPAWKVEWLEDGKVMGEMERFTGYDPYASALCKDRSIIKYDWIGPTVTEHLFKAVPSRPDARLNVRVTDRFGNVYDF